MVILSVVAVKTVRNGGKGAVDGAYSGLSIGASATGCTEIAAVGSAVSGGMTAGFIVGAIATENVDGNAIVAGGATGGAIKASLLGGGALISGGGIGGIGLLLLGASNNSNEDGATFDCWKQVIHDESKEPSRGILLKDICSHPNVLKATATEGYYPDLPKIVIENIWNEVFEIEYILVHATGKIVCHALPI